MSMIKMTEVLDEAPKSQNKGQVVQVLLFDNEAEARTSSKKMNKVFKRATNLQHYKATPAMRYLKVDSLAVRSYLVVVRAQQ